MMEINRGYRFIFWGILLSFLHVNIGSFQILPNFIAVLISAYGIRLILKRLRVEAVVCKDGAYEKSACEETAYENAVCEETAYENAVCEDMACEDAAYKKFAYEDFGKQGQRLLSIAEKLFYAKALAECAVLILNPSLIVALGSLGDVCSVVIYTSGTALHIASIYCLLKGSAALLQERRFEESAKRLDRDAVIYIVLYTAIIIAATTEFKMMDLGGFSMVLMSVMAIVFFILSIWLAATAAFIRRHYTSA